MSKPQEIDEHHPGNDEYIADWQKKHGSIESNILKAVCHNCGKSYNNHGAIFYVCCASGGLRWWHKKNCK